MNPNEILLFFDYYEWTSDWTDEYYEWKNEYYEY